MSSMYIRTKNCIYQVDSVLRDSGFVKGYNVGEMAFIRKDQVIDQSETIEDLSDEFVCEWFDKEVNRYRHVYCRFKIGQSKELYRRDIPLPADVNFEIYAGIWVNGKGLTYVAKMNDDGKLELIW